MDRFGIKETGTSSSEHSPLVVGALCGAGIGAIVWLYANLFGGRDFNPPIGPFLVVGAIIGGIGLPVVKWLL